MPREANLASSARPLGNPETRGHKKWSTVVSPKCRVACYTVASRLCRKRSDSCALISRQLKPRGKKCLQVLFVESGKLDQQSCKKRFREHVGAMGAEDENSSLCPILRLEGAREGNHGICGSQGGPADSSRTPACLRPWGRTPGP